MTISTKHIMEHLGDALVSVDLSFLGEKQSGKVRDLYRHGDKLILVATDRLSAFDYILGLVPFKGQVLTQLSAFWFDATRDLIGNHLLQVPDPNVTVARVCTPLPVEVVVRGYITGVTSTALWRQYSLGERRIYGIDFPDGLRKNDRLPEPVITPTTKARDGGHDERITGAELVASGLVPANQWERVCEAAVAIFKRGQRIARRGGLILVDTKYEFGLSPEGEVVLIDEIHTPDSSRYWIADTYEARHAAGEEPENFDKELIRLHYTARGYCGDGEPGPLPAELAVEASARYMRTYEMLTQNPFIPGETPAGLRIEQAMRKWMQKTAEV